MKKFAEIFSKEELKYLAKKIPDLVPIDLPNEIDIGCLPEPSVDQAIIGFLKKYDVNVQPRSVGEWNGWDTLSTIGGLLAREGSTLNISSTIFAANRSNQINSIAQEWGTWKRWVLDNKNKEFEKFQKELIQSVQTHNKKILQENGELITKAQLNNDKIFEVLKEPNARKYISALKRKDNLTQKRLRNGFFGLIVLLMIADYPPFIFLVLIFFFVYYLVKAKNRLETNIMKILKFFYDELLG